MYRSWRVAARAARTVGEELADEAVEALRAVIPLMGLAMRPDSDPDPTEWRFAGDGPLLMVTSPSGVHLRGMGYHLAVWPGPARAKPPTRLHDKQGLRLWRREGHIHLLYYGPDVRDAIRASNDDLRSWQTSEHYPA